MAKKDRGKDELNTRQKMNLRHKNANKASSLLTRLDNNANGNLKDPVNKEPIEMSAGQIKSAEIFLRKTMPDLQSIESNVTVKDERTFEEIKEESKAFLMRAGMSEEQAEQGLKDMAKNIIH